MFLPSTNRSYAMILAMDWTAAADVQELQQLRRKMSQMDQHESALLALRHKLTEQEALVASAEAAAAQVPSPSRRRLLVNAYLTPQQLNLHQCARSGAGGHHCEPMLIYLPCAQADAQHSEEVAYLSAKIHQLQEEKVELQAALVQQAADLDILMQAVSSSASQIRGRC